MAPELNLTVEQQARLDEIRARPPEEWGGQQAARIVYASGPSEEPSVRELQVLALVAEGFTSAETAVKLGIAQETVKKHLARLYRKLDAVDAAHAVAIVLRRGLIE